MKNYIDLVSDTLTNGFVKEDRTGVGTIAKWCDMLRWDLSEGFPILTSRRVSLRLAFEETMFFLRGQTDTKILEEKNINIWKGNTSREFLDNRGLSYLPVGDMGKGYGYQFRNFNGVDQLSLLIDGLKKDPNSRRHIMIAWNPSQLDEAALPPCHLYQQYQIMNGKLNSSFVCRSTDIMYGLPYNIMSYSLINAMLSKLLGIESGEIVFFGNDLHIYNNQLGIAKEQIDRTTSQLPKLLINKEYNDLEGLLSLEFSDIELIGYNPLPDFSDKPPMAV